MGARGAAVIGLLIAEGLTISLVVDVFGLLEALGLVELRLLVALPLVIAVAYAVMRDRNTAAPAPSPHDTSPHRTRIALRIAHVIAFATFLGIARSVTTPPYDASPVLLLLWVVVGVATVVTVVFAAYPAVSIRGFIVRERSSIALAAVVGVVAFIAALFADATWPWIAEATLRASGGIVGIFFEHAHADLDTLVVGTDTFEVIIDRSCSGTEGLGLLATLSAAYLFARRRALRMPLALLAFPAAIVLALLGNVVRIAGLVAIGASGAPQLAVAGFHSKAGWLISSAIALGLAHFVERYLASDAPERSVDRHAALYIGPLLVTLGLQLITGLFVVDLDRLGPVRLVVVTLVVVVVLRRVKLVRPGGVVPWIAGIVVFVMWWWLADRPSDDVVAAKQRALMSWSAFERTIWIVSRIAGSVVIVPIVEELAFRGYLLRRIVSEDFEQVSLSTRAPLAWLISSLAFGALHSSFVAGALAGLVFAAVAAHRGRLADAIVAHAIANAGIAAAVVGGEAWWLWF